MPANSKIAEGITRNTQNSSFLNQQALFAWHALVHMFRVNLTIDQLILDASRKC
jgi:hypothetical protein